MTDRHDDDILEAFFQTARANAPGLPAPLAARIAADAERLLPARRQAWPHGSPPLAAALGGWRPLAGLAAAGIAGLWIGIAPPAPLADLAGAVLDDPVELDLSELYAMADDAWIEG
jgi:hypothetical protein